MIIIYIDIILLTVLLALTVFACGYCVFRLRHLRQGGQVAILLRPTKVLFSHQPEPNADNELRTVVAYQNPFTGDYCVHKSRAPRGYVNEAAGASERDIGTAANASERESDDSGLSDAYEPLKPPPRMPQYEPRKAPQPTKHAPTHHTNRVDKTWNWNYKEYQI